MLIWPTVAEFFNKIYTLIYRQKKKNNPKRYPRKFSKQDPDNTLYETPKIPKTRPLKFPKRDP